MKCSVSLKTGQASKISQYILQIAQAEVYWAIKATNFSQKLITGYEIYIYNYSSNDPNFFKPIAVAH